MYPYPHPRATMQVILVWVLPQCGTMRAVSAADHGRTGHPHHLAEPTDESIDLAVETFRILADPTRVRIILHLLAGERSVSDLADAIGRPAAGVSQHLAKLRLAHLVRTRREGTTVYYSMTNVHVRQLLEDALFHTDHVDRSLPDHEATR